MLLDLEIRDFAIIDQLQVQFGSGLNALTGETGAGKSIIIDALGAVLGERVSAEMVRTGARTAFVDARFLIADLGDSTEFLELLGAHGIDASEGELILSREIQASGRSTARINGRPATVALLGALGQQLVDIHGQSDHLSLLRPAAQLTMLDRYAHLDHVRAEVGAHVREWRAAKERLDTINSDVRDRAQREDLLRYQIDEIRSAALRVGEDAELETEKSRLANAERLGQLVAFAFGQIGPDQGDGITAADGIRQASRSLGDAATLDSSLSESFERVNEAALLLEDVALQLRDYLDVVGVDPERLERVQDRIETIKLLKRKYGATIEDIILFEESAAGELEGLGTAETDELALRERVEALERRTTALSEQLSQARQAAAARLASEASAAAVDLNLGSMMFDVLVQPKPGRIKFDETGIDQVEFMFAPNRGEVAKPLARVASGGETARMMLALKSVLADSDRIATLVFDEVDVGIGGRSGQMVGQKLQQLAAGHQVIVITHLPQIAAVAEHHFKIRKDAFDGRTTSRVTLLEGEERIDEIASMIDGEPPSATSRKGAREMLERTGAVV